MLEIVKTDIKGIMKQLDELLEDSFETYYYENTTKEVMYIDKQKLIDELSKIMFDIQPNEEATVDITINGTHSITVETEEELSIGSFYDGIYTDYTTFDKEAYVYYTFYIKGNEDGWIIEDIEYDYELA